MSGRRFSVLGAVAGVALLASGCGAGKSPAAGSTSTTSSGTAPSQVQLQQIPLAFSRCMRTHGVPNFPDPQPGGGFLFQSGTGVDPSSPAFATAQAKCRKLLPNGGPPAPGTTTHPTAQWLAHMVEVSQCMRRHGIPGFPDPTTTVPRFPAGGGVISDIDGVIFEFPSSTLDTQSPLFVRAAHACGFPLHNH